MKREQAIEIILDYIQKKDIVVATTGKTGRELFELREKRKESHAQDFLNIGAMGHTSMIALGIAIAKPRRVVWCLDGDGAFLMHMGALAIIGSHYQTPSVQYKIRHIVLNNGCHDSVGGMPTAGFAIDIPAIARACGYQKAERVTTEKELEQILKKYTRAEGPTLTEIRIKKGSRENLGRPTIAPQKAKEAFMRFLRSR